MACLIVRLSGPMQSWGTRSRFRERDSEREPSKSGVVGLLCAALGRGRDEPLDDFASLDMAVRVDREGILRREFQTAEGVINAKGQVQKDPQISARYYLADAVFYVAFKGDRDFLERLHGALRRPRWQLFLGRKSYVPAEPVYLPDGLRDDDNVEKALLNYPLDEREAGIGHDDPLRLVLPDDGTSGETRLDDPVSFDIHKRRFRRRSIRTVFVPRTEFSSRRSDDETEDHDVSQ